jgi:hypothetical protein
MLTQELEEEQRPVVTIQLETVQLIAHYVPYMEKKKKFVLYPAKDSFRIKFILKD